MSGRTISKLIGFLLLLVVSFFEALIFAIPVSPERNEMLFGPNCINDEAISYTISTNLSENKKFVFAVGTSSGT